MRTARAGVQFRKCRFVAASPDAPSRWGKTEERGGAEESTTPSDDAERSVRGGALSTSCGSDTCAHRFHEAIEKVSTVVRTGRRFGVILDCKYRKI